MLRMYKSGFKPTETCDDLSAQIGWPRQAFHIDTSQARECVNATIDHAEAFGAKLHLEGNLTELADVVSARALAFALCLAFRVLALSFAFSFIQPQLHSSSLMIYGHTFRSCDTLPQSMSMLRFPSCPYHVSLFLFPFVFLSLWGTWYRDCLDPSVLLQGLVSLGSTRDIP